MSENGSGGSVASKWEWVAGAISAAIVLGMLTVLIGEATAGHTPPDVSLRVDSIVRRSENYLVAFTAHNRGTNTAAALQVEGELRADTTLVETSSVTIDYLPGEGSREGGLFFRHDPRGLSLTLRPLGYQAP